MRKLIIAIALLGLAIHLWPYEGGAPGQMSECGPFLSFHEDFSAKPYRGFVNVKDIPRPIGWRPDQIKVVVMENKEVPDFLEDGLGRGLLVFMSEKDLKEAKCLAWSHTIYKL